MEFIKSFLNEIMIRLKQANFFEVLLIIIIFLLLYIIIEYRVKKKKKSKTTSSQNQEGEKHGTLPQEKTPPSFITIKRQNKKQSLSTSLKNQTK